MERILEWVDEGTALCRTALSAQPAQSAQAAQTAQSDPAGLAAPSLLPGWSRRHVAAHLALNAAALGNLVHWARTGEERRMYPSAEARNADIEAGTTRSDEELRSWFDEASAALRASMATLTDAQWQTQVLTSRGAPIPATEIPWMRAREVMIHAVDLATGLTFADLPADFLHALCDDIRTSRGDVPEVNGTVAELAAYLCGRPYTGVTTPAGALAEPLSPWL